MIRFAKTKASGESTPAAGSRYGRGRSGSRRRNAVSETGAKAYMMAVADVTMLTSARQLGNGRNDNSPMTKATRIDHNGTPRRVSLLSAVGSTRERPIA